MFFNLSRIFPNHTITSAEMSSNSIVTAAIVSQKYKVMMTFCKSDLYKLMLQVLSVVFTDKINRTMVAMALTGTNATSNKMHVC